MTRSPSGSRPTSRQRQVDRRRDGPRVQRRPAGAPGRAASTSTSARPSAARPRQQRRAHGEAGGGRPPRASACWPPAWSAGALPTDGRTPSGPAPATPTRAGTCPSWLTKKTLRRRPDGCLARPGRAAGRATPARSGTRARGHRGAPEPAHHADARARRAAGSKSSALRATSQAPRTRTTSPTSAERRRCAARPRGRSGSVASSLSALPGLDGVSRRRRTVRLAGRRRRPRRRAWPNRIFLVCSRVSSIRIRLVRIRSEIDAEHQRSGTP